VEEKGLAHNAGVEWLKVEGVFYPLRSLTLIGERFKIIGGYRVR